jgi:3,4-dihydroxy 2-butanone 4-phosphate synthase/GTP cyclohydrolase II
LEIVDRLPLLIEANDYNSEYLATKAKKLGHLLLQTYLITVAVTWEEELMSATQRYEKLDKIRYLANAHQLLVQEEARPIAIALFSNASLIFHLGFNQPNLVTSDWYGDHSSFLIPKIGTILDSLADWQQVKHLEFLIATGDDPMTGLQVQLDRQSHPLSLKPSSVCDTLTSQTIYSFTNLVDTDNNTKLIN